MKTSMHNSWLSWSYSMTRLRPRLSSFTYCMMIRPVAFLLLLALSSGFRSIHPASRKSTLLQAKNGFPNPFKEVADMFSNMDDVIEDFMFKRMGNGEVFYGKRKYKPSGRPNTEGKLSCWYGGHRVSMNVVCSWLSLLNSPAGKYGGMGMSDSAKIDISRKRKEEYMERKRQQQEEARRKWIWLWKSSHQWSSLLANLDCTG